MKLRALVGAVAFNFFRFPIVELRQLITCSVFNPQKFVEFCVDGLGITVLRSLNKQRHKPCRYGGGALPPKRSRVYEQPRYDVHSHNGKGRRMRSRNTQEGQKFTDSLHAQQTR